MTTNLRHTSDAEAQIRSQKAHLLSARIDISQPMFFTKPIQSIMTHCSRKKEMMHDAKQKCYWA